MTPASWLLLGTLLLLLVVACAQPGACVRVYRVSTQGTDRDNSKPHDDDDDHHVSLAELAALLEEPGSALHREPSEVVFGPGTHALRRPLHIAGPPQEEGRHPALTLRGARGGAVLAGGARVVGWVPWRTVQGRTVYRAPSPQPGANIDQLFWEGTERLPRATSNRTSPAQPYLLAAGHCYNVSSENQTVGCLRFRPGQIDPGWASLGNAVVTIYSSWTASLHYIRAVNATSHEAWLRQPAWDGVYRYRMPPHVRGSYRFTVENVLELLDAPGEWYFDADSDTVYLMPPEDRDPRLAEVWAPTQGSVLTVAGRDNVVVRDLAVRYAALGCNRSSAICDGPHATWEPSAAVGVFGSRGVLLHNLTVEHVGPYAVWVGTNSSSVVVDRCTLQDLGTGGVRLSPSLAAGVGGDGGGGKRERARRSSVLRLAPPVGSGPRGVVVSNSTVQDGGKMVPQGIGVLVDDAPGTRVLHNEVTRLKYEGSLGIASPGSEWAYNHLHDLGMDVLSDMGGIRALGPGQGSRIHHNHIHDVYAYNYGSHALYFDCTPETNGYTATSNLLHDTKDSVVNLHCGFDITVENNILAYGARCHDGILCMDNGQFSLGRDGWTSALSFQRNIVFFDNSTLFSPVKAWPQQNASSIHFDNNTYYSPGRPAAATMNFPPWFKASGEDAHSLTAADPRFANASARDFRLAPDSPALALGFRPFDVSTAGPLPP